MQIVTFGLGESGEETSAEVLGGKGAGLVWMDSLGVNVPPGFILPCSLMKKYEKHPKSFMNEVAQAIIPYFEKLQLKLGYKPLVSVRSGARQSMPGTMDTVLNVGLDRETFNTWSDIINLRCVTDSYKRLIQMYANVVMGVDKHEFVDCKTLLEFELKYASKIKLLYPEKVDPTFPNADAQILAAIEAVFKSWHNERAKTFRKLNYIPEDSGTAVIIQSMVFGNMNKKSGTGVMFTRNPITGENKAVGEFLVNHQGEDVVDGSHTPMSLQAMPEWNKKVAEELLEVADKLERAKVEVQDIEFTVQDGELFILQTRHAKLQPQAALRIAFDMLDEKWIDRLGLLSRVSVRDFDLANQVIIDPKVKDEPFATGICASSGVAVGKIVYSSADALKCTEPCILVTEETNPNDIAGMYAAKGIVTMKGGMTCHAAVIARGMNKPCIVGLGKKLSEFMSGSLTLDGATGRVWFREMPVVDGSKNELNQRYIDLVQQGLDYVPIVDKYWWVSNQEKLPIYKRLMYHPGSSTLFSDEDKEAILKSVGCTEQLYIDLRDSRVDESEKTFFSLFDAKENNISGIVNYIMSLPEGQRNKITLVGHTKKGLKSITEVNSLESLILADDVVFLSNLEHINSDALEWVMQRKEFKVASYGNYTVGALNFLSHESVLQFRD